MGNQNIELKIQSTSTDDYNSIILRKFFCMVFFDPSWKKLDVFIATVFGGILKDESHSKLSPAKLLSTAVSKRKSTQQDILFPTYKKGSECGLSFLFSSDNPSKVTCKDLTISLCKQSSLVKKFWGQCEELRTTGEVSGKIKELYHDKARDIHIKEGAEKKYFYISDNEKKYYSSVVAQGDEVVCLDNGYKLLVEGSNLESGLEVINWVKCEVELSDQIVTKNVNLKISFDGTFYTPDFTWYFAPPFGYAVDGETATLRIGKKSFSNKIQQVSDSTTVEFDEWVQKPLEINNRKKSRIIEVKYTLEENPKYLSDEKFIEVSFAIKADPGIHSNRQFAIGLIVALIFSIFSDTTRIGLCYELEPPELYTILLTLLLPVVAILSCLSFVLFPHYIIPSNFSKRHILRFLRVAGFLIGLFSGFYVFFLFQFITIPSWLIDIFCGLSIISNTAYICICTIQFRLKISNYL